MYNSLRILSGFRLTSSFVCLFIHIFPIRSLATLKVFCLVANHRNIIIKHRKHTQILCLWELNTEPRTPTICDFSENPKLQSRTIFSIPEPNTGLIQRAYQCGKYRSLQISSSILCWRHQIILMILSDLKNVLFLDFWNILTLSNS